MLIVRPKNKFSELLKAPEIQFFLIFIVPFVGFFLANYYNLADQYKTAAIAAFLATLAILLLQTLYNLRIHRELKEQERNFLSVVAHQVRTPLTAVRWTLEELTKPSMREEDRSQLAQMGGMASQKLNSIIDTFNQLAKLQDGQLEFRYQPLEITDFVEQVVADAELVARQYGVVLHLEKPNQPLEVKADPTKLEVVLSNLINNGIKYNHKGGVVSVRIRPLANSRAIECTVEDTGIGLSPEEKEHVFTKYFRAEGAKRINPTGVGIGLHITREILHQHGGKIWIDSTPGKGSAFHFTLPLAK